MVPQRLPGICLWVRCVLRPPGPSRQQLEGYRYDSCLCCNAFGDPGLEVCSRLEVHLQQLIEHPA